ncbi:MAG: endonuclease/exonuclease/phosphatase family protein [Opitutaceae bacterium]
MLFTLCLLPLLGCADAQEREFTVVAYNVENLFDVDGVAIYRDYTQDEPDDAFTYSRAKLLTKLQNHASVLKALVESGPEVILFQELEADFTPESTVDDFDQFLTKHSDTTVAEMLGDEWQPEYAGLPTVAWLLKALADSEMSGYSVVTLPSKGKDAGIAHTNAVFSKFPILSTQAHPLREARDILEVKLDVEGYPLWVYSNHWKSGASNPERESTRVQNATVLRALIDERLAVDPLADIIIGGDLNSHYNHSILYPEIETGINDVLGSQGDEMAIRELEGPDLYNLWFELPPEARYSEVWRGRRGTLMHMLITRGLYDAHGIQYVDGSYDKLLLTGLNADGLGRPLVWNFVGSTGGGVTDHLPVYARYRVKEGKRGEFVDIENPSVGNDALDYEMPLAYSNISNLSLEDGAFLADVKDVDLGPYIGRLYQVEGAVTRLKPLLLNVRGAQWPIYSHNQEILEALEASGFENNPPVFRLIVNLGMWKGKRQYIVEGILD